MAYRTTSESAQMKAKGEAVLTKAWNRSKFQYMVLRYSEGIPSLNEQWIVWKFCESLAEALTFIQDEVTSGRNQEDYEVWTKCKVDE